MQLRLTEWPRFFCISMLLFRHIKYLTKLRTFQVLSLIAWSLVTVRAEGTQSTKQDHNMDKPKLVAFDLGMYQGALD